VTQQATPRSTAAGIQIISQTTLFEIGEPFLIEGEPFLIGGEPFLLKANPF